jgi:glycerol uptake facilitator-like aquaporin
VIGTFALVLGVYGLAVNRKAPPGWAGLLIALNIAGLIIFLGNVSGAEINPARAFGPVFADWTLKGSHSLGRARRLHPRGRHRRTGRSLGVPPGRQESPAAKA